MYFFLKFVWEKDLSKIYHSYMYILLIIRFQFLLLLIVSTYISRSTRKEAALDGLQLKAPPVHLKQAIL